MAFSFGSLLALDALFPRERDVPERVRSVKCLVTIGCPFDFVHMVWPEYFADRTPLRGLRWFNIYSPTDVLSSNFRSHSKKESARAGEEEAPSLDKRLTNAKWLDPPMNIEYTLGSSNDDLSIWDVLHFVGFINHGKYWDGKELTCHARNQTNRFRTYDVYHARAQDCAACPLRSRCLSKPTTSRRYLSVQVDSQPPNLIDEMKAKIDTQHGKQIYARRLGIVEPVFANICVHKRMHRFTLRSKRKVDVQWALFALVHNIGKIHTFGILI